MPIPTNAEILTRLDRLNSQTADDLETQWLELKPWSGPREDMRELLGLGESKSARVEVSRYLRRWSAPDGFLRREGVPPKVRYFNSESEQIRPNEENS